MSQTLSCNTSQGRSDFLATLISDLKRCRNKRDLERGKLLHTHAREAGCHHNRYVATALISMYSRCGSMENARHVFDNITRRDVVSWTTLILGYVENGESMEALELFTCMDCVPDKVTFLAALKACAALSTGEKTSSKTCLQRGVEVHRQAKALGLDTDVFVASTLVDMYSKCGGMEQARCVFDGMIRRDVVCWNAMILGYVDNGFCSEALELFNRMDCAPDSVSFVAALKACSGLAARVEKRTCLLKALIIHEQARQRCLDKDLYVANTLMDAYSKSGDMKRVRGVFNGILKRDVVSWNVLILGYVENGESLVALDVFHRMDHPRDSVTFLCALKACASFAAENKLDKKSSLETGMKIHGQARELGFDKDVFVSSTLVDMYSKCGDMHRAQHVFNGMIRRNTVSWTVLINGYVENGENSLALEVLNRMDCEPDRVTFVAAVKACAGLAAGNKLNRKRCAEIGMRLHQRLSELGFESDIVLLNTLVDMYSKCGEMDRALEVFNRIPNRDVVSWNSLILGYVENGDALAALNVFNRMDCAPDSLTLVAALKACATSVSEKKLEKKTCLEQGVSIHARAKDCGFDKDVFVASILVDMYSKCGDMQRARDVFNGMAPDVVTWNSLLLGYVDNGASSQALEMFNRMDSAPDCVTFVAALKACASLGALGTGQRIHKRVCQLGFERDEMVSNGLVDLYGKCGKLTTAEVVFSQMKSQDVVSWSALIGGYSLRGNTSMVFTSAKRMVEAGVAMDDITMLLILTSCSHAGMVAEAERYFGSMSKYGVRVNVDHYICMVDILGRANRLHEALEVVREMPFDGGSQVWMTLLGGCKKWRNVEIGKVAFREVVSRKDSDDVGAAYVLMRSIFESLGMQPDESIVI